MSESEFAPFAGPRADAVGFRPLLAGRAAIPDPEPVETATAAEPSDELRRAFQAGYDLGREEATGQLATVAESLVKSLEELAAFRGGLRERYERELLELALGVARKIVQQELAERPEIWLGLIRAAVRRVVDRERITVRVPPRLLAFLRDALPELRASLDSVKELELVEDPSLPTGGCIIESRFGEVNLGVEAQLEAVERALVRVDEG